MAGKYFNNRNIAIAIISVLILGLISVVSAKICNVKLLSLIDSVNPQLNSSVAGLGKLIQKGENAAVLQQQLDAVVSHSDQFSDLLVINQDAVIIAAKDNKAVGQSYPIIFRTNAVKGLPLPFFNKTTVLPARVNQYKTGPSPEQMFKVFGTYKALDNKPYYIIGSYHVNPALTARQERITAFITLGMQVYGICFILFWLLLAIWVYQDARRRPTNAAAWGILTLFTSVIGWVVYLIARPMLNLCPNCSQEQSNDLKFCTSCGALLKSCCPECGSELKEEWEYCGSCGLKLD